MSDTMRDLAWKLVPVEPTEAMQIFVHKQAWINAVAAAPASPVPADVQEITRLMNAYVWACLRAARPGLSVNDAEAEVNIPFKPLQAALTALVDDNHRLKFALDGVNAMRRLEWISVDERLPEQIDYPYQVVAIAKKAHGKESCYPGEGIRRVQQDWVIRQWPQNFTHWTPLPPPPTHGIEPEQGEVKS